MLQPTNRRVAVDPQVASLPRSRVGSLVAAGSHGLSFQGFVGCILVASRKAISKNHQVTTVKRQHTVFQSEETKATGGWGERQQSKIEVKILKKQNHGREKEGQRSQKSKLTSFIAFTHRRVEC